jgi:hypothetical protein
MPDPASPLRTPFSEFQELLRAGWPFLTAYFSGKLIEHFVLEKTNHYIASGIRKALAKIRAFSSMNISTTILLVFFVWVGVARFSPWLPYINLSIALAVGVVAFVAAHFVKSHDEAKTVIERSVVITKQDAYPECTDNEQIVYKSKVRIELRNDGEQCIDIRGATWTVESGDIPFQSPFWYRLELERTNPKQSGTNRWQEEAKEIHVRPNELFRASVGLDLPAGSSSDPKRNDTEIRKRLNARQTGTLVLRVEIGRRLEVVRIRL